MKMYKSNAYYARKAWNEFNPNDSVVEGDGFDIHHRDMNPKNNKRGNLQKLKHEKHTALHKRGGKNTPESNDKRSRALKGKSKSKETRKKMSIAQKNNPSRSMLGRHHSEETKLKMRANWGNQYTRKENREELL